MGIIKKQTFLHPLYWNGEFVEKTDETVANLTQNDRNWKNKNVKMKGIEKVERGRRIKRRKNENWEASWRLKSASNQLHSKKQWKREGWWYGTFVELEGVEKWGFQRREECNENVNVNGVSERVWKEEGTVFECVNLLFGVTLIVRWWSLLTREVVFDSQLFLFGIRVSFSM